MQEVFGSKIFDPLFSSHPQAKQSLLEKVVPIKGDLC